MTMEAELREKIATLTRIFAMRGLLGIHGHISAFDAETGRIYMCPGFAWDKATTQPGDLFVFDLKGNILEGQGRRVPIEWPIHTAIHSRRPEVGAIGHLHSPYATAFAAVNQEFRPVLLQGSMFANGVPIFPERHLITTPDLGERVADVVGGGRAALLRNHGTVIAASNPEELLFVSMILEDTARAAVEAAALGQLDFLEPEDMPANEGARLADRAQAAWKYFATLEARWDRQPPIGSVALG